MPVNALSPSPMLPPPQLVVLALDATKDHRDEEIRMAIGGLVARGDILRGGDSLLVLGVLHTITHPSEAHLLSLPFLLYLKMSVDSTEHHQTRMLSVLLFVLCYIIHTCLL